MIGPVAIAKFHAPASALILPKGDLWQAIQKSQGEFPDGWQISPLYPKGRSAAHAVFSWLKDQRSIKRIHLPAYTAQSLAYAALGSGLEIVTHDINPERLFWQRQDLANACQDPEGLVVLPYLWGFTQDREWALPMCDSGSACYLEDFATSSWQNITWPTMNSHRYAGLLTSMGKTKMWSIGEGGFLIAPKPNWYCPKGISPHWIQFALGWAYSQAWIFNLAYTLRLIPKEAYPLSPMIPTGRLRHFWSRVAAKFLNSNHFWEQSLNRAHAWNRYQELSRSLRLSIPASIGSRYPLLLPTAGMRNLVFQELQQQGLGASLGYIDSLWKVSSLQSLKLPKHSQATDVASRLLCLPAHEGVLARQNQICDIVLKHHHRVTNGGG